MAKTIIQKTKKNMKTNIFIKKGTKKDRGNTFKAMQMIPDKPGYKKVYAPYGFTGKREDRGFYYKQKTNEQPKKKHPQDMTPAEWAEERENVIQHQSY